MPKPVLLVLAAVLASTILIGPAQAHPVADKAACGANQNLIKNATYVEHDAKTKAGTPVDYIYHRVVGLKPDGSQTFIKPVHYGGPHAFETAYSSFQGNYKYYADMMVLHWISDPCSGDDNYAYATQVYAAKSINLTPTPALFKVWVALQRSADASTWASLWGYSHRENQLSRKYCYAEGGKHAVRDAAWWVRTWLYLDGLWTEPTPNLGFDARKSTSKEMLTVSTHPVENGPCYPDWCQSSSPPTSDPAGSFNSCSLS